jgi:ppGpp synthetase/RelA/SpoT-type nucleotidyltranferase
MPKPKLKSATRKQIDQLVMFYIEEQPHLNTLLGQLRESLINSNNLMLTIHSMKWRIKESEHLRKKLYRKAYELSESKKPFDITKENLFERINDLVGIRILYLYTGQFPDIHKLLIEILDEWRYELLESFVRSWDDETKNQFEKWGIETQDSESMYTSVHYVVKPNSRTHYTCEIQVRTLMEEVWGEVNHSINYPEASNSVACREQLKALARLTSACTRLVDSIYRSNEEFVALDQKTLIQ